MQIFASLTKPSENGPSSLFWVAVLHSKSHGSGRSLGLNANESPKQTASDARCFHHAALSDMKTTDSDFPTIKPKALLAISFLIMAYFLNRINRRNVAERSQPRTCSPYIEQCDRAIRYRSTRIHQQCLLDRKQPTRSQTIGAPPSVSCNATSTHRALHPLEAPNLADLRIIARRRHHEAELALRQRKHADAIAFPAVHDSIVVRECGPFVFESL